MNNNKSESFADRAFRLLLENGYRRTSPTAFVVRVLSDADRPLTAYEIGRVIRDAGNTIDDVSVYRICKKLLEVGAVYDLDFGSDRGPWLRRMNDPDSTGSTLIIDSDTKAVVEGTFSTNHFRWDRFTAPIEKAGFDVDFVEVRVYARRKDRAEAAPEAVAESTTYRTGSNGHDDDAARRTVEATAVAE